jgi:hypothetical protein
MDFRAKVMGKNVIYEYKLFIKLKYLYSLTLLKCFTL